MLFITLIVMVGFAFLLTTRLHGIVGEINSIDDKYKPYVGEIIVISKDTLYILDYSILNENFTLSNGSVINLEYAKNNIINDTIYEITN